MTRPVRIGWGAALLLFAVAPAYAAAPAPLAPAAATATVPATTALDRYLNGLNGLTATFTQTVTNGDGAQTESGSGKLTVQRPGKFRWEYTPRESGTADDSGVSNEPRGQLLVADGRNLWFYDKELAQVTVKPVESALSATPIVLLSGSNAQLHASFDISAGPFHDGLDWVEVRPRAAESDFSHAELGFSGDKLVRMIVKDRLGQTVQLDFPHSVRNPHIDAAALKFTPPAGVDVIGTPQS
ncbi:MAG: outer membrane lipoprotein chaperone LolA [Steroidobacteraceae bacterium]